MRNSNTVGLAAMLVVAMVGAPLMAGSAAATQETSAVITVVDGDNNELEDANVELTDADTGDTLGGGITGADGTLEVTWSASETTTADINVGHMDYQPYSADSALTVDAGASESYTASLVEPVGAMEIAVVTDDGATVEGANVSLLDPNAPDEDPFLTGVTDSQGLFTADDVPTDTYFVEVEDDNGIYATTGEQVTVEEGDLSTAEITMTLPDNGTLDVRAMDADTGENIANAQIRVLDDSGEVTKSVIDDGQTVLDLPDGEYTVTADHPEYAASTQDAVVTAGEVQIQNMSLLPGHTVTENVSDGDRVDEVYAEFDVSDYEAGENVTVGSQFTLILEDTDGVVTEYVNVGSVVEDIEVGADDDLHTVYQGVDGSHDGVAEVVAATDMQESDEQVTQTGYFSSAFGGIGGSSDSNTVWIGAGLSIIVIGGAALLLRRNSGEY